MVHLSSTVARRAALVVVILGVAAASAAMWNRYAPPNACLFCATPENYEAALNPTAAGVGTTGAADLHRTGQYAAANSNAIPGGAATSSSGGSSDVMHGDSRRLWTPWGTGSDAHRYVGSTTSAPSVGMGGLWRLMTLAHRSAEPLAVTAPAPKPARELKPAATPPPPKPPRNSAPAPHPPTATPIPAPAPNPVPVPEPLPPLPPTTPTSAAPSNPFNGHVTPPADPFVPPKPPGSLDPGGPGGTGPSGSGPAATPEPASLLLIGTGLLVLIGELRRRGVI